jgi:hypothetical protein
VRERALFVVAVIALLALMVEALWAAPYVATTDGPGHLYGALARAHIEDPALGFSRYVVANRPVTSNGPGDVYALLEPVLGWRAALAALLSLLTVVWGAGAVALVLTVAPPERRFVALVAASTALGWSLYHGFFAFCLGTGIAFFALAAGLRDGARARTVCALLLFGAAVAHFFAAALAGVVLFVARVAAAERRRREALLVIATGVPAALVTLLATSAVGHHDNLVEVLPLSLRVQSWGAATIGGPFWRQAPLLTVLVVSLLAGVVLLRRRDARDNALWAIAAVYLAVPLVLPWTALGWQHAAPRPLPFAAVLFCALLPLELLPRAVRVVVSLGLVTAAVASTLWARDLNERSARALDDVITAVDAVEPDPGYRWFFLLDDPFGRDEPFFRWEVARGLGQLFAMRQGGFVAGAFVNSPQSDAVLLRDDARASLPPPLLRSRWVSPIQDIDDDAARAAALLVLQSHAVQVDGVIVVERPSDHALWRARGFAVEEERGRLLRARVSGCALRVISDGEREVQTQPLGGEGLPVLGRVDVVAGDVVLERLLCGPTQVAGCEPNQVTLSTEIVPVVRCAGM